MPAQGGLQIQPDSQSGAKIPYCHCQRLITPVLTEPTDLICPCAQLAYLHCLQGNFARLYPGGFPPGIMNISIQDTESSL